MHKILKILFTTNLKIASYLVLVLSIAFQQVVLNVFQQVMRYLLKRYVLALLVMALPMYPQKH
jgi:hypothetical protein